MLLVHTAGAECPAEQSPSPWHFQYFSMLIFKLHFSDGESFLFPFPFFNRWWKDVLKIHTMQASAKTEFRPLVSCLASHPVGGDSVRKWGEKWQIEPEKNGKWSHFLALVSS